MTRTRVASRAAIPNARPDDSGRASIRGLRMRSTSRPGPSHWSRPRTWARGPARAAPHAQLDESTRGRPVDALEATATLPLVQQLAAVLGHRGDRARTAGAWRDSTRELASATGWHVCSVYGDGPEFATRTTASSSTPCSMNPRCRGRGERSMAEPPDRQRERTMRFRRSMSDHDRSSAVPAHRPVLRPRVVAVPLRDELDACPAAGAAPRPLATMRRNAAIGPDGSCPPMRRRSIAWRLAALDAASTQPGIGESYVSTGSLYPVCPGPGCRRGRRRRIGRDPGPVASGTLDLAAAAWSRASPSPSTRPSRPRVASGDAFRVVTAARPRPSDRASRARDGHVDRAGVAMRPRGGYQSRRTGMTLPRMVAAPSALSTRSATSWRTSTSANESAIWIAPTSPPVTPASCVMAPTMSPGRRPARRPPPIHSRAQPPEPGPTGTLSTGRPTR